MALEAREARPAELPRTQRRRWSAGGLSVVLVLAVAMVPGLRLSGPSADVALPPTTASPERVVGTYLDAMNAGDVETMNALVVSDQLKRSRFGSRWTVTAVSIRTAIRESTTGSAAEGWGQAVFVPVSFRTTNAPDLTIPEDVEMPWGYVLVRNRDSDPWRIIDQGPA